MRLDKFLKVARIIKRRPLAKEIAEENRIQVNGTPAKPSVTLEVGDEIAIQFAQKILTIKVLQLKENVKKDEAISLYEVVNEEKINRDE